MKRTLLTLALLCTLASCTKEPEIVEVVELSEVEGYMADPEAVARGEALFQGSCARFCHVPEPSETEERFLFDCFWLQDADDAAVADVIKSGIPNTRMVGFGSNFPEGDQDLWKLIAYLRVNQRTCD